ncbi:MAG TPA: MipA/OmpV family protein [Desulfuromonadales bacterium]|nr:MipA/OmpV family protein [Desulfuromonadales bacterium]
MKKDLKKVMVVISAFMLSMASSSFAATTVGGDLDDGTTQTVTAPTYTVGLGLAALPQYEGSKDYNGALVPFFRAQMATGQYLQLMGGTLTVNIVEDKTWQAGPLLRYRGERKPSDIDNSYFKNHPIKVVDAAVELGGFVGFQANEWNARFEMAQDVADAHKGLLATLSGGYTYAITKDASLGLNLSTTYASSNYMETYFSGPIFNGNTQIGYHTAEAGIKDVAAAVIGRYRIDPHWGLIGAVRLTELVGDGASNSPVVKDGGSSTQMTAGVLATYKF